MLPLAHSGHDRRRVGAFKTQSVPYLRDGGCHASAFLVRVLLFASFYLIDKLITNCTSGWQLLTGKSFYKAHDPVPILFVLWGLLSVPLKIKMPFHIIRVFHTVRGCLQRTAAPKGANDSFFAVGIFSRRVMTRSLGVQSQVCGGTSSL